MTKPITFELGKYLLTVGIARAPESDGPASPCTGPYVVSLAVRDPASRYWGHIEGGVADAAHWAHALLVQAAEVLGANGNTFRAASFKLVADFIPLVLPDYFARTRYVCGACEDEGRVWTTLNEGEARMHMHPLESFRKEEVKR